MPLCCPRSEHPAESALPEVDAGEPVPGQEPQGCTAVPPRVQAFPRGAGLGELQNVSLKDTGSYVCSLIHTPKEEEQELHLLVTGGSLDSSQASPVGPIHLGFRFGLNRGLI